MAQAASLGADLTAGMFDGASATVTNLTRRSSIPAAHAAPRSLGGRGSPTKTTFDRCVAGLVLVLCAPVMVVLALAVRLDSSGPVFYRQKRHGLNGAVFEILKFRTMHANRCDDGTGPDIPQATRDDPRVTRVGRVLRRSSLDELPQLLNVLRGEMSLVGPRPHAVAHNQRFAAVIDGYATRHRVRPGITGLAQVGGFRGETDTPEKMARRVELDLAYIADWSFGLDVRILLRTVLVGFLHPQAR